MAHELHHRQALRLQAFIAANPAHARLLALGSFACCLEAVVAMQGTGPVTALKDLPDVQTRRAQAASLDWISESKLHEQAAAQAARDRAGFSPLQNDASGPFSGTHWCDTLPQPLQDV